MKLWIKSNIATNLWQRTMQLSVFFPTHWCPFLSGSVCLELMVTSSNGNIFRVTGPLCGEFTGPGEFPTQRSVTRSFDVLFDLRLNKRLSKRPWGWWFETPSWSLWRHRNVAESAGGRVVPHQLHIYTPWSSRNKGLGSLHYDVIVMCNTTLSLVVLKLPHPPWTKWPPFRRQYIQMHLWDWKVWYFD